MSEVNIESSMTESVTALSETASTSSLNASSSSTSAEDEAKRRRILSKLWGKGNKLSHKVRELEKSANSVSTEPSSHNDNDQKGLDDKSSHISTKSSTTDSRAFTEDSSNSISNAKPLAVVKPIVVVKTGLLVSCATDRARVSSEASSVTITQVDETVVTPPTATVTERHSLSSTITSVITERTSSKKKNSHKDDSKKHKTTKDESADRDRSHHHHHHETNTNKTSDSSSRHHRQDQNGESSKSDDHSKSSRQQSSSKHSESKSKRRSKSHDTHRENRQSNRSTASKKDESTSSKKTSLSPVDHHRQHSSSKHDRNTDHTHSSHRHRRRSSRTHSPSPSRNHHSVSNRERAETKRSSSPKRDDRDRNSATTKSNRHQTESSSNSKSTNSTSSPDPSSKSQYHSSSNHDDNDHHRYKPQIAAENLKKPSKSDKSIEISPERPSSSSISSEIKQETSKSTLTNDRSEFDKEKPSSSKHDRRSHSRPRSKSKEHKTNRKPTETSISDDSSNNQSKSKTDRHPPTDDDHTQVQRRSNRTSPVSSSTNDRRRKSSSDHHHHRYDRHDSPSSYDRRHDSHHYRYHDSYHRNSYYPPTHYVHHHHHHHYRSRSSKYYDHRRSISPRSHHHRSRYFSSTSSSLSGSPRRRSSSRTSSSSSRSSSSYSSVSRSSSSRSSSRNHHYYFPDKKFRRSPTLEKIFLKASESIESVSTQKNPTVSSSSTTTTTHLLPVQAPPNLVTPDIQLSSSISSLSDTGTFYSEKFSGFSVPPPPFLTQPHQRYLKEITTESITSRRPVLNEVQAVQPPTSTNIDETLPAKTPAQTVDASNVRPGKPPRVSRFSDVAPTTVVPEPVVLNTNLPVDTVLNYTQITDNMNCLPASRRQQKRHNREEMECECTTSEYDRSRGIKACGHECLNRMLLIECGSKCPCGQWCTNRRFQRRSHANHKLALFKTEMKGYGLRTTASIHKGRFLVEYVGEVIDMDELARRNKKYKRDGNVHQYVMSLAHGTVIDSTIKGNWARFINHSCEPNCAAEKWLVNGEYRLGIFATRDLNPDEEITIDYRFERFGTTDLTNEKCYCGAPTCRGTISIKSTNNNSNNLNQRQNRRQPMDDDEILEYLLDTETNEYVVPKSIDEVRQLIQIMSRTDSEHVRTIELNLVRNGSQKLLELPRLFLECNGLHVLSLWMKDILIEDDEQQYSDEFKYDLLDFIQCVLPIKDRTTVIKNGLLDLVYKKLALPLSSTNITNENHDDQIQHLMNSMLDHLDNRTTTKLFQLYATWMSLKERYIIPKRKEPEPSSSHRHHHHHHHHHHSSKYSSEDSNYRYNFASRSSTTQQKPIDRPYSRRSYISRDTQRTQEQQLSKDERRKLFEQEYEDAERARAAAALATANNESPGQNEPPQKKQRTSDDTESNVPSTPPQPPSLSMSSGYPWSLQSQAGYPHQVDQTYWIHQHLSQIPVEYIRAYMASIGQSVSSSNLSNDKDEAPLPPPPRPDDEIERRRIICLPSGWSVAMCPSDSAVYFYNRSTMETSWTPPSLSTPMESSDSVLPTNPPLDLSPLSSAQIHGQHRADHDQQQLASSSHSLAKALKYPHRHSRSHRHHHHHHHHHHLTGNNKRKRPETVESTHDTQVEPSLHSKEQTSTFVSTEQFTSEEPNDKTSAESAEDMRVERTNSNVDSNAEDNVSITVKDTSSINDNNDNNLLTLSFKMNRDLLRKNISQHVHVTLKPYTKRTCRQGRITSSDDIKYLVKKFTLAVLDKEIEKAKNDGIPLSPVLSERVKLKTELYVKKYMNKVGSIYQRHDTNTQLSSQPTQQTSATVTTITTAASNSE